MEFTNKKLEYLVVSPGAFMIAFIFSSMDFPNLKQKSSSKWF